MKSLKDTMYHAICLFNHMEQSFWGGHLPAIVDKVAVLPQLHLPELTVISV